MSAKENAATASPVTVVGKLPTLSKTNLNRISAFLVQDQTLVTEAPVSAGGTFQFRLLPPIVFNPCWIVILGPRGLDVQTLLSRTELPRLSLASAASNLANTRDAKGGTITLDFTKLDVSDKIIDLWWIWCRTYTVSGVLQSANGCPVPGAEVTVYNVRTGIIGPVKSPIETVTTDAQGKFTATFNWCECLCCWPCWPIWWHCWPWWWERDILAVLETIERQVPLPGPQVRSLLAASSAPLKRPAAADLMTGRGFARETAELKQDSARTALIASKFANPRIRELFPWWWWCCENPNLVFSATQIGNIVLEEDPATSTRWCFPSGQSVTLIANNNAISVCPPPPVCEGFAWVSVGNPGTLVTDIVNGYAKGTPGTDTADLAFNGFLNLYGGFSDPGIPFYQVWSGLWTGNENPARGGTAPGTAQTLALPLSSTVVIYRNATNTFDYIPVALGPCSFMGINNLYMTTSQRMNPPAGVTGLGSTPTLNPGDFVVTWSNAGRIMAAPASALVSPQAGGGVSLWAVAYDAAGTELLLVNNNPLTLMIDTRDVSQAVINSLLAFDKNGNPVGLSGSSTTECPAYHIGPDGYLLLHVTVTDNDPGPTQSVNEHLLGYQIDTQFGHGSTSVPTSPAHRGYAQAPPTFTGVDAGYLVPNNAQVSFVGGGDTIQINPKVSCCYDFQLWAGKRTTDGQDFFGTWTNYDFQTATIDVS
jgi:hypothetical protein